MSDVSSDPLARCELHEEQNCAICAATQETDNGGQRLPAPPGMYVSIRGGKGVYHHPDCYNVTGDWDGADMATLGERVIHRADELATLGLRPASCCQPPEKSR